MQKNGSYSEKILKVKYVHFCKKKKEEFVFTLSFHTPVEQLSD